MSLSPLLSRAPYRVRLGTQAIVEDRFGESAFVVVEPINDPVERLAFAEGWVALANAYAASVADRPSHPQAAE